MEIPSHLGPLAGFVCILLSSKMLFTLHNQRSTSKRAVNDRCEDFLPSEYYSNNALLVPSHEDCLLYLNSSTKSKTAKNRTRAEDIVLWEICPTAENKLCWQDITHSQRKCDESAQFTVGDFPKKVHKMRFLAETKLAVKVDSSLKWTMPTSPPAVCEYILCTMCGNQHFRRCFCFVDGSLSGQCPSILSAKDDDGVNKNTLDLNLILFLGISRAHFYKDFPLTLSVLDQIKEQQTYHFIGLQATSLFRKHLLSDLFLKTDTNSSFEYYADGNSHRNQSLMDVVFSFGLKIQLLFLSTHGNTFSALRGQFPDLIDFMQSSSYAESAKGTLRIFIVFCDADHGLRPNEADSAMESFLSDNLYAANIIVSDVGGLNDPLAQQSAFWHMDQFNPPFILSLPNKLLDSPLTTALDRMQQEVITHSDIGHLMQWLLYLQGSDHSVNKPCQSVQFLMHRLRSRLPNSCCINFKFHHPIPCLCRATQSTPLRDIYPKGNDTIQVAIAEFALGVLNDQVSSEHSISHVCPRLMGKQFRLIRLSYMGGDGIEIELRITSVPIPHQNLTSNLLQTFRHHIIIQRTFHVKRLTLIKFHEIDNGITSSADCLVPERLRGLCQCYPQRLPRPPSDPSHLFPEWNFEIPSIVKRLHEDCLYFITRSYNGHSYAFEFSNWCEEKSYQVDLHMVVRHMALSHPLPWQLNLRGQSHSMVLTAWKDTYTSLRPTLMYSVDFKDVSN